MVTRLRLFRDLFDIEPIDYKPCSFTCDIYTRTHPRGGLREE